MRISKVSPCLLLLTQLSCLSRAPTDYELDKRAGRAPEQVAPAPLALSVDSHDTKPPAGPMLVPPEIVPVWIYGHSQTDGTWLQGTWVFVEVQPARWAGRGE